MIRKHFPQLILIAIVFLGLFLRLLGLNWDQSQHLHPDERFLTMVVTEMKLPQSMGDYLDSSRSTFNPNNVGFNFFVYGTAPLTISKLAAHFFGMDNYNGITLIGRLLSAFYDFGVIFLVFKTVQLLEKKYQSISRKAKYYGAFLYAVAVLPIQNAHFFTVDSFLNLMAFAAFYSALRFYVTKHVNWAIGAGIFLGLAFGAKVSAVFMAPLIAGVILLAFFPLRKRELGQLLLAVVVFGSAGYLAVRLADPHIFASGNFLDPKLNPLFVQNIQQLQGMSNPDGWFPPLVQWLNKKPIVFALQNIIVFGVGIPYFIMALYGGVLLAKMKQILLLAIIVWCLAFFSYQSYQLAASMRYFYFLYPFIAIFAGFGMAKIAQSHPRFTIPILLLIIIWPLSFMSIYLRPHSRVMASQWLYQNIPAGSVITAEHWDDALPLSLDSDRYAQRYNIIELPVFENDTEDKWRRMEELLERADYLILTSNRGYGSIGTVPERYPQMSQFYTDLFASKTAFKKVQEITSYPTIPFGLSGIPLDDQWAEEAFTVYDHPKITIFKKQ